MVLILVVTVTVGNALFLGGAGRQGPRARQHGDSVPRAA
jgi:hypothetical protein